MELEEDHQQQSSQRKQVSAFRLPDQWKPNGVNVNSWSCDCVLVAVWYKLKPKQLRAVGVAQLETSMHQREFCELTACPRAEQIPCICIELTGDKPCLNVVCLWYVSGIVSLSLHLSS